MPAKAYRYLIDSPPRVLAFGFAIIILIGSFLLSLPAASAAGQRTDWIDALFTATSATCVTGLAVYDTSSHYSLFGQIVILALIQLGGLGFMTAGTLVALFLKRKISLKERLLLQAALNQNSMEGIVRLVKRVVLYTVCIELAGAVLLTVRFMIDFPAGRAVYFGVFHAVSLFNNSGFSLMGEFRSFSMYVGDPWMNFTAMSLIILGGIGFVVLAELADFRSRRQLSLHAKVVLSVSGLLIAAGALVIFLFEYTNHETLGQLSLGEKILASFFQSVVPRTGGVHTVDISQLRQATQFVMIVLMFIGASPGSTGGGVKTTTFAALIFSVAAMLRGKEEVVMFRRRLAKEQVYRALSVTLFALAIVLSAAMVLAATEDHHFLMILFEVTSAFGTVGLSMGLTPDLTMPGKVIIILLMFVGRLGPLMLTYLIAPKQERVVYRHAEGNILIG